MLLEQIAERQRKSNALSESIRAALNKIPWEKSENGSPHGVAQQKEGSERLNEIFSIPLHSEEDVAALEATLTEQKIAELFKKRLRQPGQCESSESKPNIPDLLFTAILTMGHRPLQLLFQEVKQ